MKWKLKIGSSADQSLLSALRLMLVLVSHSSSKEKQYLEIVDTQNRSHEWFLIGFSRLLMVINTK